MKFRKKPIVIDAIKFDGENSSEIINWAHKHCHPAMNASVRLAPFNDRLVVRTPEGLMEASIGDWIIKGIEGEFYPVKPGIFEASYESAIDEQEEKRLSEK